MTSNVPEIRFDGYEGEWEKKKLGEITKYANGGSFEEFVKGNGKYELVTLKSINMSGELVESGKFIDNETVDKLKSGTLIMILSEQSPGLLGKTAVIPQNDYYVLNQRVASLTPNETTNSYFLSKLINVNQRYFGQKGAGTKVQNISKPNVENFILNLPHKDEQQAIGSFFKELDDRIALQQTSLESLKETKQGFLQKMFPKKGETTPEIRFEGFEGEWEFNVLNKGLKEYTDRVYIEDDITYKQVSVKNVGEICLRGEKLGSKIGRKRQAKINLDKYPDTIVFTRQTIEQGGIGIAPIEVNGAIVTENMPTISINTNEFSVEYLVAFFKTNSFRQLVITPNMFGGTAQIAIHEDDILKTAVYIPCIDEQQAIGSFFKELDEAITLEEQELELLKETKKAFLQKMFV